MSISLTALFLAPSARAAPAGRRILLRCFAKANIDAPGRVAASGLREMLASRCYSAATQPASPAGRAMLCDASQERASWRESRLLPDRCYAAKREWLCAALSSVMAADAAILGASRGHRAGGGSRGYPEFTLQVRGQGAIDGEACSGARLHLTARRNHPGHDQSGPGRRLRLSAPIALVRR